MQTIRGTDPNWQGGSQLGDLEDQHLTDHRRVWWTLYPYNPQRNTTIIAFVHILPGNYGDSHGDGATDGDRS
jgi:hypothetical protein